jgi:hypothetical protein
VDDIQQSGDYKGGPSSTKNLSAQIGVRTERYYHP